MKYRLIFSVAAAALLGSAMPAGAAVTRADSLPAASAVARFYESRKEPLWLRSPQAISALLDALRSSTLDGFGTGPDLASSIERALSDADAGVPGASREAERLMSNAFVLHAQALRWPGTARVIYADPSLIPHVPAPSEVLNQAAAAPDLAAHVRRTASVNPIYAALKSAAADRLRFGEEPSAALKATLDRTRILPSGGRYVLVDIAAQELLMMEDGRIADRMKVVVGKPEMSTPLMAGTLRQVTFNPYWNVPVDLAAKNIAPSVIRHGLGWFGARGYEVLSGWAPGAQVVDPSTVDWKAVAEGRAEARIRQKPGRGNMMGTMKFQFPNELGIFLHDTPDRSLFAESERVFSSGCVRLEDAPRLARWLMGLEARPASDRSEEEVALRQPVPVFLTYLTARPQADGAIAYSPDIYGLDGSGSNGPQRVAAAW